MLAALVIWIFHRFGHWYLSTSCLHGDCEHCQGPTAYAGGVKEPATCKYCPARCRHRCHRPTARHA
jgi:hypothetical protein